MMQAESMFQSLIILGFLLVKEVVNKLSQESGVMK